MASSKSIFDALNKMRIEENVDESYDSSVSAVSPITKSDTATKVSQDKDKVDYIKHNRKGDTKIKVKKPANQETTDTTEDDSDEEIEKRGVKLDDVKPNVKIEEYPEEEEDNDNEDAGTVEESITIEEEDMDKVLEILTVLDVPISIIEYFNSSDYSKVFEFLKKEHGIRFEKVDGDISEDVSKGKQLYTLKEGVKLGVLDNGYSTTDVTNWNNSVLIYEGGKDNIALEKLDETSFRLVLKEEKIDREININSDEINKILR